MIAATGTKTTNWKPGAVVRTIVAVLAFVLAAFSVLTSLLAKSGFLELSSGAWLTLVARYVYGVERDTGSFATGFVTLDNAGGGVYSGDPDDLLFTNPTTGHLAFWTVFIFSQTSVRSDRYGASARFEMTPSQFSLAACSNIF